MNDLIIYAIISLVSLMVGAILGFLATRYFITKQIKEWQKEMKEPDKEQVRNMLSSLGRKPSEEQVNRFINMTKSSAKKNQNNSKQKSLKLKKKK